MITRGSAAWLPYTAPFGYARFAPSTVTQLGDLPVTGVRLSDMTPHPEHVLISIKNKGIRWLSNGGTPTATEGLYLPAGVLFPVENCFAWLGSLKFIDAGEGAAEVVFEYFKARS